ncbi:MAG: HNH endonuclease [Lachnospiraceae bacterium]|nr:HNH endonuclease [Lachnospiraceae bacterium]
MKEFSKETTESAEVKTNPMEDIKIAPKSEISVEQADDIYYNITEGIDADVLEMEVEDKETEQIEAEFGETREHYNTYDDRIAHTPKENSVLGSWEGDRGESKFVPNPETEAGRAALEKLKEKDMDGVEYKNAEPDFSKCAESTVEIDDMTQNRDDYYDKDGNLKQGNFTQADIKCAEKWNAEAKDGRTDWTARSVSDWRHENMCSWHERCDTKTMDLVPYDIHSQCKHLGGVSECKVRDAVDIGGDFDE